MKKFYALVELSKGQLISERLFDFLNFPKQKFDEFLPQNLKIGLIKNIEARYAVHARWSYKEQSYKEPALRFWKKIKNQP